MDFGFGEEKMDWEEENDGFFGVFPQFVSSSFMPPVPPFLESTDEQKFETEEPEFTQQLTNEFSETDFFANIPNTFSANNTTNDTINNSINNKNSNIAVNNDNHSRQMLSANNMPPVINNNNNSNNMNVQNMNQDNSFNSNFRKRSRNDFPTVAQDSNKRQMHSQYTIVISEQPPIEVRTRTPGENRTFSVAVNVVGDFSQFSHLIISLAFADAPVNSQDKSKLIPKQSILGGTKMMPISVDGSVEFSNLSMSEASTKNEEREFCLRFAFQRQSDGRKVQSHIQTTPFYAYSHKKVLTRRKNIKLRAISNLYGDYKGGGEMHVVGQPFIKGPSLKCVITTNGLAGDSSRYSTEILYSSSSANPSLRLERYSDTVLFFILPPCPEPVESIYAALQGDTCTTNQNSNSNSSLSAFPSSNSLVSEDRLRSLSVETKYSSILHKAINTHNLSANNPINSTSSGYIRHGEDIYIRCSVQVTNDGRHFSNPLEFYYILSGSKKHHFL